jgi:hypothetical protein
MGRREPAHERQLLIYRLRQRSRAADKASAAVVHRGDVVRARGQLGGRELCRASRKGHSL